MKYILTIVFALSVLALNAQIDNLSQQKNIFFQDELTFGAQINTNGWAIDARRGYFVNNKLKNFFEYRFTIIKHPKEFKSTSYYSLTKSYVYGKLNQVYNFNAGYGKQIKLFSKQEVGTVDIRLITSAGINIAVLKPIYYEIILNQQFETDYEKFDPSHQPGLILGKAPFYKGLNELKINPAIYFKLGTSFEHSKSVNAVKSLELGIEAFLFLKDLEIMAEVDNPQFIVSLFLSYRIGTLMKTKGGTGLDL